MSIIRKQTLVTHPISIPIYNKLICFILGDPEEVKEYLFDTTGYNCVFDEYCNAVEIHIGLTSWIWFDPEKITLSILVHELSHAVFDLMDDIGLQHSDQEAFCYLLEYLIEQCKDIFAIQMGAINLPSEQEADQASS